MRATFTDTIEIKVTLDTDDIKSICDAVAEVNPASQMDKDEFFDIAMEEVIKDYFDGYTWYKNDMSTYEVEEICPTIVEKIAEYIDWYIFHYYWVKQEDFKWSD